MQMEKKRNYVISLSTASERRKHIIEEFGKQDIPFEFFDAITPDLVDVKAREFSIDISGSPLTKGEIACAISHIALWHKLLNENLDYICIFEDDIYLGENAKEFLSSICISNDFHIIKLEKHNERIKFSSKVKQSICGRKLYKLNSTHYGTAGYIITQQGVKYILDKMQYYHLSIPIDDLIFGELLINKEYYVLQVIPALTIQDFLYHPQKVKLSSDLKKEREQRFDRFNSKKKKTLWHKIKREILRPLEKIIINLSTKYVKFK